MVSFLFFFFPFRFREGETYWQGFLLREKKYGIERADFRLAVRQLT